MTELPADRLPAAQTYPEPMARLKEDGRKLGVWTAGALLTAAGFKAWLVISGVVPFNADEAVVALMARHIQAGARPVFFYGQAYMGSLDAVLVAAGFSIFGQHVWVIRLVQTVLYLLTVASTVWLGKKVWGRWEVGVLAAWFMALPTVNVALYTTASLGNYGEALVIGNLVLILSLKITDSLRNKSSVSTPWDGKLAKQELILWLAWGLLAGLGMWAFGLTLVYSGPAALYLFWQVWQTGHNSRSFFRQVFLPRLLITVAGLLIGSGPWWAYAFQNGLGVLVHELIGGGIAGVEGLPWLAQTGQHLFNFLLLGSTVIFGLRPPWEVRWLGLPLLPVALGFWLLVAATALRSLSADDPERRPLTLLLGVAVTLIAGFVLTPFGADPSGRYFLPLWMVLALLGAGLVWSWRARWGVWVWALPVAVLTFNIWGTVQSAARFPPGLTTQFDPVAQVDHRDLDRLMDFLRENGEMSGFTNYWVAYPLAFLSGEELVFVPRLPYHLDFRYTPRDDRYPPYGQRVEATSRVAYITTHHAPLNQFLREAFRGRGLDWREEQIGDYHVFYDLSAPVTPLEFGLGE